MSFRKPLMNVFSKYSSISRKSKMELFNRIMKPAENEILLDVGAQAGPYNSNSMQMINSYPWKKNISAVNISSEQIESINKYYPEVNTVVADACKLPWPDKYFDIVYSNAVIEHVGDFHRQMEMASEIMRVGKRWFVSTPNRWYPFEFHSRLPLVTWLPCKGYLWASSLFSYNHVKGKYTIGIKKTHNLRLLSSRELRKCFPGSRIIKHRVTFMAEVLIAVGGEPRR